MIHLTLSEKPFTMVPPRRMQQVSGSGKSCCSEEDYQNRGRKRKRERNEDVKRLRKGNENLQEQFEFKSKASDDLKRKNDNIQKIYILRNL